jgi:sugar phosphate permease
VIQVSPGVMSSELMRAYSLTGAGLGNLAACFFYAYLIMQIPVGLLLDRWSPRFITAGAAFFCALGTLLFAHTQMLYQAEISRFLMGLAAAFAAVSCFKLTSLWFPPKKFALVAGLSMTAAMIGAIGGEAPLSFLVTHYGWRHALTGVALGGFCLSLLIVLIVRDKAVDRHSDPVKNDVSWAQSMKRILTDKQTWYLSWYSGLAFAPVSVFGGLWGVGFLEEAYSLNAFNAAKFVSLIFVGFAIGCPLMGWLSDYCSKRKPLMIAGSLLALVSLSLVLYRNNSHELLEVFLFLFGFGASGFFICFSVIREIHPFIFSATVLGFMNTFDSLCEAVTEPFVGRLLDLSWTGSLREGVRVFSLHDYRLGLSVLPIYLATALVLLFFIRETHCKQQ